MYSAVPFGVLAAWIAKFSSVCRGFPDFHRYIEDPPLVFIDHHRHLLVARKRVFRKVGVQIKCLFDTVQFTECAIPRSQSVSTSRPSLGRTKGYFTEWPSAGRCTGLAKQRLILPAVLSGYSGHKIADKTMGRERKL